MTRPIGSAGGRAGCGIILKMQPHTWLDGLTGRPLNEALQGEIRPIPKCPTKVGRFQDRMQPVQPCAFLRSLDPRGGSGSRRQIQRNVVQIHSVWLCG